ncbi:helix-turn-helix transcriptional regulator [Archangium violaceum]|uniref:helix-turn-helix domain-containing protein n=1 Tax=Archangium violaceum TaxID=83451 RepID=UPI00193C755F|nr:helix-turn-helix transcriptional regulator [Archangium violaceum]QRK05221.1 helix-turn-helix transcriptional regulator [Archangium violaceum]
MAQVHKTQAKLALHIGAMAREARKSAGLTQEEAAELVGVATEVYGRLERGNMLPSLPTFMRLCRALAVDANRLLGFSSSNPPAWLTLELPGDGEPPAMRRLLRTVRKLRPRQLTALSHVASALLPSPGTRAPHKTKRAS